MVTKGQMRHPYGDENVSYLDWMVDSKPTHVIKSNRTKHIYTQINTIKLGNSQ